MKDEFEDNSSGSTALAETNTSGAIARETQAIQASLIIAQKFPRNEQKAYTSLLRDCERTGFANDAEYSFPRGTSTVTGPSAVFARTAARHWGNIDYGTEIVRDTDNDRQIRSYAWDKQTGTRSFSEASFRKLVQRKKFEKGKYVGTEWVPVDERDLRELTNKHGAIGERNCILKLIPNDMVDDALGTCADTRKKEIATDPDAALKRIIRSFDKINIDPKMLEEYLGHALKSSSPAEIDKLRGIFKSISDGNSTWDEHVTAKTVDSTTHPKTNSVAEGTASSLNDIKARHGVSDPKQQPSSPETGTATAASTVSQSQPAEAQNSTDKSTLTSGTELPSETKTPTQAGSTSPKEGLFEAPNPFANETKRGGRR